MELAKGKINELKVSFLVLSESGRNDKNEFYFVSNYFLCVNDKWSGAISYEDYEKHKLHLKGDILKVILEAQGKGKTGQELINILASNVEVNEWLDSIRPILFKGDGVGEMRIEFKYPESLTPKEKVAGLDLPSGINTFTIAELEDAFNRVVSANNGKIYDGIKNGHIKLEDSLPWFEIGFKEKSSVTKAKKFCQQLADEMNIRILFNRIEGGLKEFSVFGVMDIDYEEVEKGCTVVPALSRDGEWAAFMEDYGTVILPSHTKKKSKKTKLQT